MEMQSAKTIYFSTNQDPIGLEARSKFRVDTTFGQNAGVDQETGSAGLLFRINANGTPTYANASPNGNAFPQLTGNAAFRCFYQDFDVQPFNGQSIELNAHATGYSRLEQRVYGTFGNTTLVRTTWSCRYRDSSTSRRGGARPSTSSARRPRT